MSDIFTTIIIADSRGRGLDDFVGNHPTPINHKYVLQIKPGKSLAQLTPTIISTINAYDSDKTYCIVFAGICGLTDRIINRGKNYLRYKEAFREEQVTCNIDAAKFLKNSFGDKINLCNIVPADLINYFSIHNQGCPIPEYLVQEQLALEEDITTINKVLLDLNSKTITNVNICSRFQVKSKKKRQRSGSKVVYRRVAKFNYSELIDGVHFSNKLKNQIFGLILNTAIRDLSSPSPNLHFEEAHTQQPRPVGFQNLQITIDNSASIVSDSDSD